MKVSLTVAVVASLTVVLATIPAQAGPGGFRSSPGVRSPKVDRPRSQPKPRVTQRESISTSVKPALEAKLDEVMIDGDESTEFCNSQRTPRPPRSRNDPKSTGVHECREPAIQR